MRVTFLLPRTGEKPIGGFKIIYQYGEKIASSGHEVNYVYGIICRKDLPRIIRYAYCFVRSIRYLKYRFFKNWKPYKWFNREMLGRHYLRLSLSEKQLPPSDVVIGSSWTTALWLNDYKTIAQENKYYFIQAYENWHGGDDKVIATWKMALKKIVIAPWLKEMADRMGEESVMIENGFSLTDFFVENDVKSRDPQTVMMLWHDNPIKRSSMGLSICKSIHELIPNLKLILFGVEPGPDNLPDWIEYYQQPSISQLRKLYNSAAVFIGTSSSEGWGLTVGEAMLCGCAVACTDNGGYKAMAIDGQTALVSPVDDEVSLKQNIVRLITDQKLRTTLALQAAEYVKKFDFNTQADKFMKLIMNR